MVFYILAMLLSCIMIVAGGKILTLNNPSLREERTFTKWDIYGTLIGVSIYFVAIISKH